MSDETAAGTAGDDSDEEVSDEQMLREILLMVRGNFENVEVRQQAGRIVLYANNLYLGITEDGFVTFVLFNDKAEVVFDGYIDTLNASRDGRLAIYCLPQRTLSQVDVNRLMTVLECLGCMDDTIEQLIQKFYDRARADQASAASTASAASKITETTAGG